MLVNDHKNETCTYHLSFYMTKMNYELGEGTFFFALQDHRSQLNLETCQNGIQTIWFGLVSPTHNYTTSNQCWV